MATSRTGTGKYRRNRAIVLATAQRNGLTHCPGYDTPHGHRECGAILDYETPLQPNRAETDHIIPHSMGGTDNRTNLTVLCRTCNNEKSNGQNQHPPTPRPHHYTTSRTLLKRTCPPPRGVPPPPTTHRR